MGGAGVVCERMKSQCTLTRVSVRYHRSHTVRRRLPVPRPRHTPSIPHEAPPVTGLADTLCGRA
jgi:hypothetical protein